MKAWYVGFSNGITLLVFLGSIVLILLTGAQHPRLWQVAIALGWASMPILVVSTPQSRVLAKAVLATTSVLDLGVAGGCVYGAFAIRTLTTANVLIPAISFVALLVAARGISGIMIAMAGPIEAGHGPDGY